MDWPKATTRESYLNDKRVFRVFFPKIHFLFPTGFCLDSPGPLDSKEKYVFAAFKCLCLQKTYLNFLMNLVVLWISLPLVRLLIL